MCDILSSNGLVRVFALESCRFFEVANVVPALDAARFPGGLRKNVKKCDEND